MMIQIPLLANTQFGYISYSGVNIGDDIQAIAAKQFLPKDSIPIDREYLDEFSYHKPVYTIMNGWYMHTKNNWYCQDQIPPEKSWPPSDDICPLIISMHITPTVYKEIFSPRGIAYLKKHGPIGARDLSTLKALQDRDIPCYFSGCLTLTLNNTNPKILRNNIIYAVDVDKTIVSYLRKHSKYPVVEVSHGIPREIYIARDNDQRISYAQNMLNKYAEAKCIVTARLHAALPCLALKTPVLLIAGQTDRFHGLTELTHHTTKKELLEGRSGYDLNNPPENPDDYLKIRNAIIKKINDWKEKVLLDQ